MLQQVSTFQCETNLRSVTNSDLFIPLTHLGLCEQAFSSASCSSAASRLLNTLSTDIKTATKLLTIKNKLKTFSQNTDADFIVSYHHLITWWRGGLVVGRRTCDLVVTGSRPGRDAAA